MSNSELKWKNNQIQFYAILSLIEKSIIDQLRSGMVTYSLWAESSHCLLLLITLYGNTATLAHWPLVYGHFHATETWLSSWNADHMVFKA